MRLPRRTSAAISPTAHYTGHVWSRHGLSAPGFDTVEGKLMYAVGRPVERLAKVLRVGDMEQFLLARHTVLDKLLREAIVAGQVGQVIEVAAGLSPRGWRFSQEFPDLTYVDADLPGMAARKREVVARAGGSHRVVDLDALADDGPQSLAALVATLDPTVGTVIITEGLLMYFDRPDVEGMWHRFATVLQGFPVGVYLSDLHLLSENDHPLLTAGRRVLGWGVRGSVNFSFADAPDAAAALRKAGFAGATLHRPAAHGIESRTANAVRVIEARV